LLRWVALFPALPALLLFGCAQPPPTAAPMPSAPGAEPPSGPATGALRLTYQRPLRSPPTAMEVLRLEGKGSQVFRCESQPAGLRWTYRLPEAELRDTKGQLVMRHGVNLSFEHVDGSRLVGEIVDHVPSPSGESLPWLLLKARGFGEGALEGISYVQRINTVGGMPPSSCEPGQLNQVLRVPFSAEFVFFR
ncbi:MAG TPA: DUF3455 domain-containing protein, partial [Burkholderiaceae bacterium]|nr:DUF3455 domain-containing protein [Burkholderiaceae bacterium]